MIRRLENTFPIVVHPRHGAFDGGFGNIDLPRHRGERRSPCRRGGRNRYRNVVCAAVFKRSLDRGLDQLTRRSVFVQYQDDIDKIFDP